MSLDERGGDWNEYRRLVVSQLEGHGSTLGEIRGDIGLIKTDLALLKAGVYRRAGTIGLATGGGSAALAHLIVYILQHWP